MVVLSLDTTTRTGSCAVARDGRVVRETASDPSRSHAERLPGELSVLLNEAALTLADVDVFAVATGPGSFTGMRVGIATMQGLAFALAKPLVGVSALDALARAAGVPCGRVATWIDAWRGEVYAALYEDGAEMETPTVAHPDDLLARLGLRPPDAAVPLTFVGDGADLHRESIQRALGAAARIATPPAPLLAGVIAAIAGEAARAGERPPPHAIRPLYVRRSDAELARAQRPPR